MDLQRRKAVKQEEHYKKVLDPQSRSAACKPVFAQLASARRSAIKIQFS